MSLSMTVVGRRVTVSDMMKETRWAMAGLGDGGKGYKLRGAGSLWKPEKSRERVLF